MTKVPEEDLANLRALRDEFIDLQNQAAVLVAKANVKTQEFNLALAEAHAKHKIPADVPIDLDAK